MKLLHWMKDENSGLARTTLELVKYEELQGHAPVIRQPESEKPLYGIDGGDADVDLIHSQIGGSSFHDKTRPKIMWMHGEPLSSVALTNDELQAADCVIIVTDHSDIDYKHVCSLVPLIIDTRNALNGDVRRQSKARVIRL